MLKSMTAFTSSVLQDPHPYRGRFGAGLSEAEVRRFQMILERDCGVRVSLPDAWGRAIALLSLVELLLEPGSVLVEVDKLSTEFALPRS